MEALEAYQLAAQLHTGQVDKAARPYIEHLPRVFKRPHLLDEVRSTRTKYVAAGVSSFSVQ